MTKNLFFLLHIHHDYRTTRQSPFFLFILLPLLFVIIFSCVMVRVRVRSFKLSAKVAWMQEEQSKKKREKKSSGKDCTKNYTRSVANEIGAK